MVVRLFVMLQADMNADTVQHNLFDNGIRQPLVGIMTVRSGIHKVAFTQYRRCEQDFSSNRAYYLVLPNSCQRRLAYGMYSEMS